MCISVGICSSVSEVQCSVGRGKGCLSNSQSCVGDKKRDAKNVLVCVQAKSKQSVG